MKLNEIESSFENKPFITGTKLLLFGVVGLVVIGVAGSWLVSAGKVLTAPSRVIGKTLDTNNIIQSYEWFYDVNAGYQARSAQVAEFVALQNEATSDGDKSKLRTELSAMRQSCRELATKYNANSEKMNKSVFKGWSLPDTLSTSTCEAS